MTVPSFLPSYQLQRKDESPTVSKISPSLVFPADGSSWDCVFWQQKNPSIEGGPGQGPDQPGYKCLWKWSVYLWLQDCVPSAIWASGIIYLECCAAYIPRIKKVLSFPIEKKRAKSLFKHFPSALSYTWVLTQETSFRECSSKRSDFSWITFGKLHNSLWLHTSNLTPLQFPLWIWVCASSQSCWDEFAAGVSKKGRGNNFVFVYRRKRRCS